MRAGVAPLTAGRVASIASPSVCLHKPFMSFLLMKSRGACCCGLDILDSQLDLAWNNALGSQHLYLERLAACLAYSITSQPQGCASTAIQGFLSRNSSCNRSFQMARKQRADHASSWSQEVRVATSNSKAWGRDDEEKDEEEVMWLHNAHAGASSYQKPALSFHTH